ncbi:tRNA (adenosine(37)-N6)-threonylcarbamoyltransferase complex transferase subunit TsaD [Basilea psittacipulmonis]|uniref:tRNA N6-adenosine threonylcarbamoyltransferase n=1 Tax=Basilea psittacipulmonis DSM 24701 TaxID=1072685 RepID=A0A077DDY4_9BURK|nr:tRNA (adenosine(37)-N6)-threonylcarbamoyltransferase complex transferase subunit TsaD [Basilea psittacipulmonis]AIL32839.1 UGMP family protein [Basilea psittacipulmonis DSM 24701]
MNILAFESSCDETGVAIYHLEKGLLAHTLHSQIDMHRAYGGVVPELASRDHIRRIMPLLQTCYEQAGVTLNDIDVIAYTAGPGLGGALLVGASFAQALAYARKIPTVAIHHLEGHLLSPLMGEEVPEFPFVALLVSGGHTQIMQVNGVGDYILLGETLDDAAGEAFDKSAKLMGLSYPGGPVLAKMAAHGNPKAYDLPRPMKHSGDLDFSFSGLKTAVLTLTKKLEKEGKSIDDNDVAASIQAAIIDILGSKSIAAMKQTGLKRLVVAGGVGANLQLRSFLTEEMKKLGGSVYFPPLALCTDNGAMIAHAAALRIRAGLLDINKLDYRTEIHPRWDLASYQT